MFTSTKRKIYIPVIFALLMVMSIFSIGTFATVSPTPDFYVNDYANLLDEETKDYIIKTNENLCSQTGAQIVVVTVPNLGGDSLENYANQLFRSFGIGDKTKNNGVLLLLTLEERKFRIEVGYGLEGILPDGKTGRIQDEYIIPYLKQDNWNDGIKNGFNAILEIVAEEYHVSIGAEKAVGVQNNRVNAYLFLGVFLSSPLLGVVLGLLAKNKIKKRKIYTFTIIVIFLILSVTFSNLIFERAIDKTFIAIFLNLSFLLSYFMAWKLKNTSRYIKKDYDDDYWESRSSGGSYFGGGSLVEVVRLVVEEVQEVFSQNSETKQYLFFFPVRFIDTWIAVHGELLKAMLALSPIEST